MNNPILNKILGTPQEQKKHQKPMNIPAKGNIIYHQNGVRIEERSCLLTDDFEKRRLPIFEWFPAFSEAPISAFDELLFYDTETTGLAGGSGTYLFLFGSGYVSNGRFVLVQFFLEKLSSEYQFLEKIRDFIKQFSLFISFNGKSYDSTLLHNRAQFHQIDIPIKEYIHFDLLHLSRRLWKTKLQSCSLESLEYFILHFERDWETDIAGRDIPEVYFQFLEDGNTSDIVHVLNHNLHDIVSMYVLLYIVTQVFTARLHYSVFEIDPIGIAKTWFLLKHPEKAEKILYSLPQVEAVQSFLFHILLQQKKQEKSIELAKEIYHFDASASLFLAKYYEHKKKDYMNAEKFAETYYSLLKVSAFHSSKKLQEATHRLARIRKKKEEK